MRIRRHLHSTTGQGLLEVVLVMVFFSAAVAVAMPAYLGFQGRRAEKSAHEHLVTAVHVASAYRADHGSYRGMDAFDLMTIDPRVSPGLSVAWAKRGSYCLTDTVHGKTWSVRAPYKGDPELFSNGTCD